MPTGSWTYIKMLSTSVSSFYSKGHYICISPVLPNRVATLAGWQHWDNIYIYIYMVKWYPTLWQFILFRISRHILRSHLTLDVYCFHNTQKLTIAYIIPAIPWCYQLASLLPSLRPARLWVAIPSKRYVQIVACWLKLKRFIWKQS